MRAIEFIYEADASDTELAKRYPGYTPAERDFAPTLGRDPGPTLWSCRDVITDILGANNVTDDDAEIKPGMYLMYDGVKDPLFRAMDTREEGGSIEVPNLDSHSAADVAGAAHEAYHAYAHSKSEGGVYSNEKIINSLAERWVKQHLTGPSLHYALETLTKSRVSYGHNHIPKGPLSDRR